MRIFILSFLLSFKLLASTSDFQSHFFINGQKVTAGAPLMVTPNSPTLIEVYFTNPSTNEIYKDFKLMHGKHMHMVILDKNLSVFKHIHPYFDPSTGRFAITVNMPYADPDNQDAVTTLKRPGMYMIMADVIVSRVGMRMGHSMLMVKGATTSPNLIPDPDVNNVITKYFSRDQENPPLYKAIFKQKSISGCSGNIVKFEIEMFKLDNGIYRPLLDFQSWLKEAAHAVWVSDGLMRHSPLRVPFAHMHSPMMMDDDDDDSNNRVFDHILRFNYHDEGLMRPGLQKMWIEFKHQDKVMKLPFIFSYQRDLN